MKNFSYLCVNGDIRLYQVPPSEVEALKYESTDGRTIYALMGEEEQNKLETLQSFIN